MVRPTFNNMLNRSNKNDNNNNNNNNERQRQQQEMVSLIPRGDQEEMQKKKKRLVPKNIRSAPLSSESSTKSGGRMKKRSTKPKYDADDDEERVALIDMSGMPSKPKGGARQNKKRESNKHSKKAREDEQWTLTRLMKYLSLTCITAIITFWVLQRESKELHWEEYQHVLEPNLAKKEQRCFIADKHKPDERCSCPDPTKPLINNTKQWKVHHDVMYMDAKNAPKDLDIVFLGDNMIERWNGTSQLGLEQMEGMRQVFEKKFTKRGGGQLEGLALGSSGDTGPNILWHLKNGVLEPLKPKVWMILVGMNDLYELKCTDRFVVANILNVLKAITTHQPDAQFIMHGILPRKDNPTSKSQFLGTIWHRAQAINLQLRKFCEHKVQMHYMQAGPLFMEETDEKGRRQIDVTKMSDGVHPTVEGLEVWGDYIEKQVRSIIRAADQMKAKMKEGEEDVG